MIAEEDDMPTQGFEVVKRYRAGRALLKWEPGGETFTVLRVPGALELLAESRRRGRGMSFRALVEALANSSDAAARKPRVSKRKGG